MKSDSSRSVISDKAALKTKLFIRLFLSGLPVRIFIKQSNVGQIKIFENRLVEFCNEKLLVWLFSLVELNLCRRAGILELLVEREAVFFEKHRLSADNLRKSFEQRAGVSDAADGRLVFDLVGDVVDGHFLEPAARRLLVEVGLVLSPAEPDEGEVALVDAGENAERVHLFCSFQKLSF